MSEHNFKGRWITDEEFYDLQPRNVFHKQLDQRELPCEEHRNRHILFRKRFDCPAVKAATLYISADDYYKVYINGVFVGQGPAPSYHFNYNYNAIEVGQYLKAGENVISVHTLYQGLINRVWQSGDLRHGLILDLVAEGETLVASDESFKTAPHSSYEEMGTCGYKTQFLERYDSNGAEVGFTEPDFDDSGWHNARIRLHADYTMTLQTSYMLEFERVEPMRVTEREQGFLYDFGSNYVGYLCLTATGKKGTVITVRCGQELNGDGTLRHELRANCTYEEEWILSGNRDVLDWCDYKAFRYAEIQINGEAEIGEAYLSVRHYPFTLRNRLKAEYAENEALKRIWELCVHTQKYGVQEVIQDCMEREKGFYLGDGCYTALANLVLTGDETMVRKLIDDAFSTTVITDTLVTCMDCSFMQEIAEYPLILVQLVLWHYNCTGDAAYLRSNYEKVVQLLDAYRRDYEKDYILRELDKWCVVEWPENFRHGYDVDILEGKVCHEAHVSINAYYLAAIKAANAIASCLALPQYREEQPLTDAFMKAFYHRESGLFKDGETTSHISLVGNAFVYGFGLYDAEDYRKRFLELYSEHGIRSLSFFCVFPVLMGFARNGEDGLIREALLDEGAWKRMLREDATTTFEGWGKETKWNTSLFHLTMSYAALFMAELDLKKTFGEGETLC